MAFQMSIDTDNAAFADDPAAEVARILRGILDKVESWDGDTKFQTVFDINGNDVGRWKLEAEPQAASGAYTFVDEGTVGGVQYVTVVNDTGDPIDYNLTLDDAQAEYGNQRLVDNPAEVEIDEREYPEDEDAAALREASARSPGLAFTADGSEEPERPQA